MQFYRSAGQKSGEMAAACNPEECTVPTVELESVTQVECMRDLEFFVFLSEDCFDKYILREQIVFFN